MSSIAVIATVVGISAIVLSFYYGIKFAGKASSSGATNGTVTGTGGNGAFDDDGDADGGDGAGLGGDGGGLGGDGGGGI